MLGITLDSQKEQPLFLQLARAVSDHIRQGRLKPGEALPGSRELALCLGVNRNTVIAGYQELKSEGLISTRIGGGTFVANNLVRASAANEIIVDSPTRSPTYSLRPLRHTAPHPANSGSLMVTNSVPDSRLFPARKLARAFRRAIESQRRIALHNTDPRGQGCLRRELANMLARMRGLAVTSDNVMITRSIEQGIDLVARTLIAPGDVVVVESFGYPPAWSLLKLAGARLLPVTVDKEGLDVDALEELLKHQCVRAVFLTPHHQFPTTAIMSTRRRERLAELSILHRFAIIEDDYDHEFHFQGKPILPIAAGRNAANVIYVGSLANILAPGVSTGFVVAPPSVFEHLVSLRAASDARNDAAMECAIAALFEDGELLRHALRVRQIYASRCDALASALKDHLGDVISFHVPNGGMAIWARIERDIDLQVWSRNGATEGVAFSGAQPFDFFHREQPFLRLGFSYHDETELTELVKRLARALPRSPVCRAQPVLRETVQHKNVESKRQIALPAGLTN